MDNLYNIIDRQIGFNKGTNLFSPTKESFDYFAETIIAIKNIEKQKEFSPQSLIDYAKKKVLEEFYRVNQYYNFNCEAKIELNNIYSKLFEEISDKYFLPKDLAIRHYLRLKRWLRKTAPFAEKMYQNGTECIDSVHCYEYSPALQLDILRINIESIMEPVLDVGCGKEQLLVKYLQSQSVTISGIDRYSSCNTNVENKDWLEYDFGVDKWGTVVSNLGFSNHFIHHHYRKDGDFVVYAEKYMQILGSLKVGGSFHYAPDLPFIEQYLDRDKYRISYKCFDSKTYRSVIIQRII